jgi:Arc/MetJ-type ribon-helix-helix transcriptional regulator
MRLTVSVTPGERAALARIAGERAARGERLSLSETVRHAVRSMIERERDAQGQREAGSQPAAA